MTSSAAVIKSMAPTICREIPQPRVRLSLFPFSGEARGNSNVSFSLVREVSFATSSSSSFFFSSKRTE